MANRVVHFEIEAQDKERAKNFYSAAFGWEMQQQGEEMGNYVVVVTGDPQIPGGINGGIYQQTGNTKQINGYRCVISVDDIQKAIADVRTAGGTVTGEAQPIPGIGLFVSGIDTEGNHFTLLQPSMESQS